MTHVNAEATVAPIRVRADRVSPLWKDRRLGIGLAAGIVALAGVIVSLTLPRGPSTQTQALLVLVGGVLVGSLAGLAMRSRWAMLFAPFMHIVALELARPNLLGPTAGAIRLNDVYGVLAFALGRGLYALVAVIPMILGAYLGAVLANRLLESSSPSGNAFVRWVPSVLATLILVALAAWIALPASTPPILGADGERLPGQHRGADQRATRRA